MHTQKEYTVLYVRLFVTKTDNIKLRQRQKEYKPDLKSVLYSFVTVYCMNVNLKLFSLSLVPLLAPNPGDDAGQTDRQHYHANTASSTISKKLTSSTHHYRTQAKCQR